MKIVTVIPISRGIVKEELSYYSSDEVAPGDIVTVPLRKRSVRALVTSSTTVRTKKASLRTAGYTIRKIESIHTKTPFSIEFMSAVQKTAHYYASTTGAVLHSVLPLTLIKKLPAANITSTKKSDIYEIYAFQDSVDIRIAYYKSLIRELFSKEQSIMFILPTRVESELLYKELRQGVEQYTHLLHSNISKTKQYSIWNELLSSKHPVCVIATPIFMSLPRHDVGMLVIEREHSRHYRTNTKPYIDFRVFAGFLAETLNTSVIYGDELLRFETLQKFRARTYTPISQPKAKYPARSKTSVIDMRIYSKTEGNTFQILSNEALTTLKKLSISDHCFIFSIRTGLFPLTVCKDCGDLVLCEDCNIPVVVHTQKNVRLNKFVCHRCNKERSAKEYCKHCNSWNLLPLGIGSQRVREEVESLFPNTPLFFVDSKMSLPHTQKVIDSWQNARGSVLVGTERVLPYLTNHTHTVVASADTLFSLPDFRAHEHLFRILFELRSKTNNEFLIQTRNPENSVFEYIQDGNVHGWYQEELHDRKELQYPPFSTLIKITMRGTRDTVLKYQNDLKKTLADYSLEIFSAFSSREKGKSIVHALISLQPDVWPDDILVEILRKLPPHYTIMVDPEHLL